MSASAYLQSVFNTSSHVCINSFAFFLVVDIEVSCIEGLRVMMSVTVVGEDGGVMFQKIEICLTTSVGIQ